MKSDVEDAIRQVHATAAHRDQLQKEADESQKVLEVQRAEIDRLNLTLTQLSAERDMYQCRCAVLGNELTIIKNMIVDAERKARSDSLGQPDLDDEAISYTPRIRDN